MTRAAIYARVSTSEQAEKSIPAQEAACRAWCDEHGHDVVAVFKDEGVSAWSGKERPGYEAAKRAAEAGEFDVLVVDSYDRLSRGADQESILGACWAFKALDVEVESASEHTPTDAALAAMMRLMYSITANQESERKSARAKRGYAERTKRGKHAGRVPFGYVTSPDGLVPDPLTAHVVKSMYEDFASGVAQQEIARRLTRDGVPTKRGGEWVQGTVRGILSNPVYTGKVVHLGEVMPGTHEPLVTEELFDRVQSRLTKRGEQTAERRGREASRHVLSRLAVCFQCGETLEARLGPERKDGTRYETYLCPTASGKREGWCDFKPVPRHQLDASVVEYLTGHVIDVEATKAAWAAARDNGVARARAELAAAEAVLTAKQAAVDRTLRDYTEGRIDVDAWATVRGVVEPERDAAEAAVEAARERLSEARAVPEPDVEAQVAEALAGLQERVRDGIESVDNVAAIRAKLGEVFAGFLVGPGPVTRDPENVPAPLRGPRLVVPVLKEGFMPDQPFPEVRPVPLPFPSGWNNGKGLASTCFWPVAIEVREAA